MPMRWTPENDQTLLLKILETSNIQVDTKAIAERWPEKDSETKPTPRAITERLVKIRQQCRDAGSGGFKVSSSQNKKPRDGPIAPRKPRTSIKKETKNNSLIKDEPTFNGSDSSKDEDEDDSYYGNHSAQAASFSHSNLDGSASFGNRPARSHNGFTSSFSHAAPVSANSFSHRATDGASSFGTGVSDIPALLTSSGALSGNEASQPPTPSGSKRRYDTIKVENEPGIDDDLYECSIADESPSKKAKAASFGGPFGRTPAAQLDFSNPMKFIDDEAY